MNRSANCCGGTPIPSRLPTALVTLRKLTGHNKAIIPRIYGIQIVQSKWIKIRIKKNLSDTRIRTIGDEQISRIVEGYPFWIMQAGIRGSPTITGETSPKFAPQRCLSSHWHQLSRIRLLPASAQ